jgi:hypothetical protein
MPALPQFADHLVRRLRYGAPITVVSGLPRSGTSMAMKMLEAGGMELLTDGARKADEQNPNGYYELEAVKGLDKDGDASWLRDARGKGVKVVSHLLTWLPEIYDYRVIFMERSLDEIIASQDKMLDVRGHAIDGGDADHAKAAFERHLDQTMRFLANRRCFKTLRVSYTETVRRPQAAAERIAAFLDHKMNVAAMAAVADEALYRNRRESAPDSVGRSKHGSNSAPRAGVRCADTR